MSYILYFCLKALLIVYIYCPFLLERLKFKVPIIDMRIKDLYYVKNVKQQILESSPTNILMESNMADIDFFNYDNIYLFKSCLKVKII